MNEFKWERFVKESNYENNAIKLDNLVRELLKEADSDVNCDEILYGIDKILFKMTLKESIQAQILLKKTLKEAK